MPCQLIAVNPAKRSKINKEKRKIIENLSATYKLRSDLHWTTLYKLK